MFAEKMYTELRMRCMTMTQIRESRWCNLISAAKMIKQEVGVEAEVKLTKKNDLAALKDEFKKYS